MNKRTNFTQFLVACSLMFVLLAACGQGAEPTPTRVPLSTEEQAKADLIDAYYTQLTQDGKFSGTVLIEYQGKIILDKGYGQADRQKGTPNTIQTRFRLFNASKPFTTLGILLLEGQGKLALTDLICKFLDDCPTKWANFTIENLLAGTSGLHDYTMVTPIKKTWDQPITRKDLATLLKGVSLDTPFMDLTWEGATDYALLGLIIERVSGDTYENFIQRNVIDVLGLKNTGFVHGQGEADNLAIFYKGKNAEPIAPAIDVSNLVGYGSAYSSAEDLLILIKAIQNSSLISKEITARMLSPDENWSGLGWMIYEFDGNTWVTNYIGFSHARSLQAAVAWTTNGEWLQIALANQQDVNTVLHHEYVACLPGQPFHGEESWAGYIACER